MVSYSLVDDTHHCPRHIVCVCANIGTSMDIDVNIGLSISDVGGGPHTLATVQSEDDEFGI